MGQMGKGDMSTLSEEGKRRAALLRKARARVLERAREMEKDTDVGSSNMHSTDMHSSEASESV